MSDTVLEEVRSVMSRYTDMPNILQSMNDKGTLQQITLCLHDIFSSEIDFASKRLKSLVSHMIKEGKQIDLQEQLTRNLNIFKTNFDVILNLTVQKVWYEVQIMKPRKESKIQTLANLSDLTQSYNVRNSSTTYVSPMNGSKKSNQRTQDNLANTQQSFMSRGSPSQSLGKSLSKSKYENMNMSVSSLKSFNSKNGGPVPFSEISCISGSPATFNKAVRNLDNSLTTVSPGVGRYNKIENGERLVRRSSPNVKIDKAPKISWIDQKLRQEDSQSPGPKYEVSKHFCSKPRK